MCCWLRKRVNLHFPEEVCTPQGDASAPSLAVLFIFLLYPFRVNVFFVCNQHNFTFIHDHWPLFMPFFFKFAMAIWGYFVEMAHVLVSELIVKCRNRYSLPGTHVDMFRDVSYHVVTVYVSTAKIYTMQGVSWYTCWLTLPSASFIFCILSR
jgi:hypothetical protein